MHQLCRIVGLPVSVLRRSFQYSSGRSRVVDVRLASGGAELVAGKYAQARTYGQQISLLSF